MSAWHRWLFDVDLMKHPNQRTEGLLKFEDALDKYLTEGKVNKEKYDELVSLAVKLTELLRLNEPNNHGSR